MSKLTLARYPRRRTCILYTLSLLLHMAFDETMQVGLRRHLVALQTWSPRKMHISSPTLSPQTPEKQHTYTTVELFASHLLSRSVTAEQMVSEADANGSGNINIEEFTDVCLRILRLPMTTEEIEVVFQFVDKDQRGSATSSEFKEAVRAATISASAALEKNGTFIPFSTSPAHFWRHEHRSSLGPNPNHEHRLPPS